MPDLDRLFASASGLVTTTAARDAGVTEESLRRAVADGTARRVRRGVYADRALWDPAPPSERYRLTVRGVLLAHPSWAASHHAALVVHNLPMHDVDLRLVDVAAEVRTSKRRDGTHVHRLEHQVEVVDGLRTVGAAAACVLTATASGVEAGVVAMDAALRSGACTREGLEQAATALGVRRGVGHAHAAVTLADGLSESPGESRTRLLLSGLGVPLRSQVDVHDAQGFVGRVDLLVGERVVVEFDGMTKYEGADGPEALAREKRREERLRDAGYRVVRVVWADLARPAELLARVRAALVAAAA